MTSIEINIEDVKLDSSNRTVKEVSFAGELDASNIDQEAKKIYQLIDSLPEKAALIFNYEKLEYMNSRSIGFLTDWYSKLEEKKGKLVILKAQENIQDILNIVGLNQIIDFYPSLEEAKQSLV